jgi:hypothetical protein
MLPGTFLELYAKARSQEASGTQSQPLHMKPEPTWRTRIAQTLVRVAMQLDAEQTGREVTGQASA